MLTLSPEAIEAALAACRSIRFAVNNATRHGGDFSLNDIIAADRLAGKALALADKPAALRKGKKGRAS